MDNLNVKLLRKSIGQRRKHVTIKSFYADHSWAEDLDIINELGGHTGCVNALSWSAGGGLLASGSDDKYLNIWDYNPANLAKPFSLNTSVSTGHSANIFSVKFMPHSNDRTVVTCAGDSEVRVFDLEYGGASNGGDGTSASTRSRRFNDFFGNAKWLNEGNTNARVYRSHADRAKRIVTESSPHLFLTCSEDGEVRQWDLRQPSSAYPPPMGMRRMGRFRTGYNEDSSDHAPPPLISYKKFQLELNSISCSASQPHYIALGGHHLHCFLHDRRMLGRDISNEHGRPTSASPVAGTNVDEVMREATKCVRRFAPNNKRRMKLHDPGHITACKISDARPNELISSWSGDHIYSFDIVRSPDAREKESKDNKIAEEIRLRNQVERKRKRAKANELSASETSMSKRRLRRVGDDTTESGQTALRVRFGNGESEDIPIGANDPESELARARDTLLTEVQRQSERIASSLVQLRRTLFDFSAAIDENQARTMENSTELTPFTTTFTKAMGQSATLLSEMDDLIRAWSYPVNPSHAEVEYQNTLRRNRQSSWRFVQAAGTLSATLGGKLQTTSMAEDPRMNNFSVIRPAPREGHHIIQQSRFCYDFLKAILLWLNGGLDAVVEGFKKSTRGHEDTERFPLSSEDNLKTGPEKLRDYLLSMAVGKPVIDLGRNRFERNELRAVFESQHAAVQSFYRALTGIALRVNHGVSGIESDSSKRTKMRVMDKGAAARFWGLKVGRSLLMDAAPDVTFSYVNHAFGGPRIRVISDEENFGHALYSNSSDDEELVVESMDLVNNTTEHGNDTFLGQSFSASLATDPAEEIILDGSEQVAEIPDILVASAEAEEDLPVEEDNDDKNDNDNDDDDEEEEQEEDDDDDDDNENDLTEDSVVEYDDGEDEEQESESSDENTRPVYRSRAAFGRSRERANVNLDVPYSSHTKIYQGHCNTRTVKDVNYYGLDDEYIVSGSDDGHFFIWDRKTCQIINILEGDGEVVNVVQGHPYEPIIACSGIDNTVKIFGPGGKSRDRFRASRGLDIANPGGSLHSSLRSGRFRRSSTDNLEANTTTAETRPAQSDGDDNYDDVDQNEDNDANLDDNNVQSFKNGLRSRRAMSRCYEITSQNDVMRRDGASDTLITEGMLARFATILQRGDLQGIAGQGFGGAEGATIVLDDNCTVM